MTGYEDQLTVCSGCKKDMVIGFYGFAPAFSIRCPDCTQKAKEAGYLKGLFEWIVTTQKENGK